MNRADLQSNWETLLGGGDISSSIETIRQASRDPNLSSFAIMILLRYAIMNAHWSDASNMLLSASDIEREIAGKNMKSSLDLSPDLEMGPLLDTFLRILADPRPSIARESAARAIAQIARKGGDLSRAAPRLREVLREKNKTIRSAVAEALAHQALRSHDQSLMDALLGHESPLVAARLFTAIENAPRHFVLSPKLFERTLQALREESKDVRQAAAKALLEIVKREKPAGKRDLASRVLAVAEGPGESNRGKALEELIEECSGITEQLIAPGELAGMIGKLEHEPEQRVLVLSRLLFSRARGLDTSPALAPCEKLLFTNANYVKALAVRFLMYSYMDAGQWDRATRLITHNDPDVRDGAVHAAHVQGVLSDIGPLVPALTNLTKTGGAGAAGAKTALTGTMLMGKTQVDEHVAELVRQLYSDDSSIRKNAARELAAGTVMGAKIPQEAIARIHGMRLEILKQDSGFPEIRMGRDLGDGRSFRALFDSYDQYHEDLYYVVTIFTRGVESCRFMVQLAAPVDLQSEEFKLNLFSQLEDQARIGKPNTPYRGSMVDSMAGRMNDLLQYSES